MGFHSRFRETASDAMRSHSSSPLFRTCCMCFYSVKERGVCQAMVYFNLYSLPTLSLMDLLIQVRSEFVLKSGQAGSCVP